MIRIESNESLAVLIQNGRTDLYPLLWNQVQAFVRKIANMYASMDFGERKLEFDDLYQSGYLALVEAVKTFRPDQGKSFMGWLCYYLKGEFANVGGYRTNKEKSDPIHNAISLSTKLYDSFDGEALEDVIIDSMASEAFIRAEDRIFTYQLHNALESIIEALPKVDAGIIRKYYYEGKNGADLAAELGVSQSYIHERRKNALKALRHTMVVHRRLKEFQQYLEDCTPYYANVGVNRFNSTHTSSVENAVLIRERLRSNSDSRDCY